jgi:hypothetical protein
MAVTAHISPALRFVPTESLTDPHISNTAI